MRKPKIGDIVYFFHHNWMKDKELKAYPAIITFYADNEKGYARIKIFDCPHAETAQVFYSTKPQFEKWSWPEEEKQCVHGHTYFNAMYASCNGETDEPENKAEELIEKIWETLKTPKHSYEPGQYLSDVIHLIKEYKGIK